MEKPKTILDDLVEAANDLNNSNVDVIIQKTKKKKRRLQIKFDQSNLTDKRFNMHKGYKELVKD